MKVHYILYLAESLLHLLENFQGECWNNLILKDINILVFSELSNYSFSASSHFLISKKILLSLLRIFKVYNTTSWDTCVSLNGYYSETNK